MGASDGFAVGIAAGLLTGVAVYVLIVRPAIPNLVSTAVAQELDAELARQGIIGELRSPITRVIQRGVERGVRESLP